ncbi:MAG TPA: hypothetical protein VIK93_09865 [Limnochordales bacterium]
MTQRTTSDDLRTVMAQLRQLAESGQREEFAGYCRAVLRQYGRNDEALMRLARFCQKQGWHGGFELFMTRLAERMPQSRAGILLTLGEHLIKAGRQRGLDYLRQAAGSAVQQAGGEAVLRRAIHAAAEYLRARDDWEAAVETFPPEVRGELYLELAGLWGTDAPERSWRAYRRGLRLRPDAWPGEALVAVALAYARRIAASEPAAAVEALLWAAERADDPRLESQAAAIAMQAGDKVQALRLSRQVARRLPNDLENLHRLVTLQAEAGEWGAVAALAPAVGVAVGRLMPWQREDYVGTLDLALEACLRTGQTAQARAVLEQARVPDRWRKDWEARLAQGGRG